MVAQDTVREKGADMFEPHADTDASDESDEEGDDDLLKVCLPVSGKPLPPGGAPPQDADEYLRMVQWERMHCPEIVEADVEDKPRRRNKGHRPNNSRSVFSHECCYEMPVELIPRPEWTGDVVIAFRQLRDRCQELRAEHPGHQHLSVDGWNSRCTGGSPSSSFLIKQGFLSVNNLILASIDTLIAAQNNESFAIAAASEALPEDSKHNTVDDESFGAGHSVPGMRTGAVEATTVVGIAPGPLVPFDADGGRLAEWAFAALLWVEEPLVDDIQHALQKLRRACQRALQAAYDISGSATRQPSPPCATAVTGDDPRGRAALLLSVVQEVFGQR